MSKQDYASLFRVATISEVARCWNKHPNSVRRALDSKKRALRFRMSGAVILIDVETVLERWGEPKLPLTF